MVATKRAAPKAPSSPARASKAAKKDHFGDACMSVLSVLEQDASLSDAARSMLAAAAPFALRPSKEERHRYQAETVTALEEIYARLEANGKDAVKNLEKSSMESTESKAGCESALSQAKEVEAAKLEAQQCAKKVMEEAQGEVPKAKKTVAEAKAAEEGLEKKHEKDKAEKAERDQLITDTWTKLKEGNFPAKEWQLRKKKSEIIVGVLDGLDAEASLKLALPVALKTKPEERGIFGKSSIEIADTILQQSLKDMGAKVDAHESNVSEAKAAIAAAEEALAKAKASVDEKETAFIAAENEHMNAINKTTAEKDSLKKLVACGKAAMAELAAALENSTRLTSLQIQFAGLVEGGAAAAEPKAPEPELVEEPAQKDEEAPSAEGADVTVV